MAAAASLLTNAWSSALLVLVGKIVLCVLVYPVALFVLWVLSGRPHGLERVALGYVTSAAAARGRPAR